VKIEPPQAAGDGATREAIQGEMRDLARAHERRRRQFPRALLVGVLAGLVAVAFRSSLVISEHLRDRLVAWAHAHAPWGAIAPVAFGAICAGISVLLVRRVAPETSGSGIPHLKAVLHHLRPMLWRRVLPIKFLGGVLGIGAGLALGREGPTIQMGGAVGEMVSRWLRTTPRERRTLIAAGAGAGLAAAFNAPLSGLVFVLEEVQRDFTPTVFTASFIAAVTADVVARWLTGQAPVFHVAVGDAPPIASLPAFAVLGLAAGLFGVLFNRGLLAGLNVFQRLRGWPASVTGAIAGALAGAVAWYAPSAVGTGTGMLEAMLAGRLGLGLLLGLFALRFVLTTVSYGSGAPGGIFAPLLVLGAQLGLVVGDLAHRVAPSVQVEPVTFAVVGMAAYFAAIVRAPLTGIVLIVEMTGGYELMLPLLIACLAAYATADLLGDLPIYERLLERELTRGGGRAELEGPLLLDLSIEHGAAFEGKAIGEIALPSGCLLVTVRRGREEHVPTPEMRLAAGDRVSLLIGPAAAEGIGALRAGTQRAREAPVAGGSGRT
jgi:chloride channel protein, CIC family